MTKRTITEDTPMTYTAADGARIEVRVAGPERVFTLTINGERTLTTVNEEYVRTMAHSAAVAHNARGAVMAAPAQMESPLPAAERCASGLAAGATLTMPTEPQYRIMHVSAKWTPAGTPVVLQRWRGCNITMLRALARRGWVELNHPIRPSHGTLTDAGRKALARYDAKHGTPAGAR